MSADTIATAIIAGVAFLFGALMVRSDMRKHVEAANSARDDLRARLATVTGQLADERARLALRVNRAHEGACKGAAKRKAMRINIESQRTAVQDLPERRT